MSHDSKPHVAIVGAGPVGLDAALAAAEAGLPFTVYEGGARVADHVRRWGHVRLFSPWDVNLSPRMRRALAAAGRQAPEGDACPTGEELRREALVPLAELPAVAPNLRLASRVEAIGRAGLLKHEEIASDTRAGRRFRLLVCDAGEDAGQDNGKAGAERWEEADLVLDCTGVYGRPNRLGDGGIPAPGERRHDDRIDRHLPDVFAERERWAGKTVLVAGAGHSATTALRDLARLAEEEPGTKIVWLLRRVPDWAAGEGADPEPDPLPERGRLREDARALYAGASPAVQVVVGTVRRVASDGNDRLVVEVRDGEGAGDEASGVAGGAAGGAASGAASGLAVREIVADRILSLTGYVPNLALHRQLQVHTCYATEGPMKLAAALLGAGDGGADCLAQESQGADTLLNPEPGFFILGAKSYGRNSAFLMRLGYSQVDEVFAHLAAGASR